METTKKAKRVNDSWSQSYEKKILYRLAKATPSWINSDHMTALGIVAAFIISIGYLLTHHSIWWLLLCNIGLVLHWYGDSLDGTLARVRDQERERYGYFIDHICDVWTIFIIAVAMGLSPLLQMETALFVALAYCLMNVYVHIVAYTRQQFLMSHGKLGPTEFRIIFIIINCIAIFWNPYLFIVQEIQITAFDLVGIGIGTGLVLLFTKNTINGAMFLYILESKKKIKK